MWDGKSGVKALAIGLGLAVLVTAGFPVAAYDNKDLGKSKSYLAGGAHRLINQLALDLLVEQAAEDPILRYYDFAPDKKALGIEKLRPQDDPDGQWYAELFTPTGSDVVRNGQTRAELQQIEEDTAKTFRSWIIDGGYSADEPEKYMSWRHFFNPVAGPGQGEPWLTDIPLNDSALTNFATAYDAVMGESNPHIDSRTWVFSHPENPWSWQKQQAYLDEAFAAHFPARAYASAWRSLGQAMHSMADMSVPAHVRNDSHPGNDVSVTAFDSFRADAYEYIVSANLAIIRENAGRPIANVLVSDLIDQAQNPVDLFTLVASYVNAHFFSNDTIPYIVQSPNGGMDALVDNNLDNFVFSLPDYREPRRRDELSLNYVVDDELGQMITYHGSWLDDNGWDQVPPLVTQAAVKSQAERLVPIAIHSAAKILDLGLPRVTVDAVRFDAETLSGTVTLYQRRDDGSFSSTPGLNTTQRLIATITKLENGKQQSVLLPPTPISNGQFSIRLDDLATYSTYVTQYLDAALPISIEVGLDLGGILVRSASASVPLLAVEPKGQEIPAHGLAEWTVQLVNAPENTRLRWDFGDGSSYRDSDELVLSTVYDTPGKYYGHVYLMDAATGQVLTRDYFSVTVAAESLETTAETAETTEPHMSESEAMETAAPSGQSDDQLRQAREASQSALDNYLGWLEGYRDYLATGRSYYLVEDSELLAWTNNEGDKIYSEYLSGNITREESDARGAALWRAYYLRCWQLTLDREYQALMDRIGQIEAEYGVSISGLPDTPTTAGEHPNTYDAGQLVVS